MLSIAESRSLISGSVSALCFLLAKKRLGSKQPRPAPYRKELLKLLKKTMFVGWLLASITMLACGASQAALDAQSTQIGTSTLQPAPNTERSLEVVGYYELFCEGGGFIPFVEISVNSEDYWVPYGSGELNVFAPNGAVIASKTMDFALAANQIGWVPSTFVSAGGSKIEQTVFGITDVQWAQSDRSPRDYDQVKIEFLSYELTDSSIPIRSVSVQVENRSDFVMQSANLFAAAFNSQGELVTLLASQEGDIDYGTVATYTATPLSSWCTGPLDPSDHYTIHYWIDYWTYADEPVTYYGEFPSSDSSD